VGALRKSLLIILTVVFIFGAALTAQAENSINRISGEDRFITAIEISKSGWTSADTAVLAVYNNFADALVSAPLAYKFNAPILLSETSKLTNVTKNELNRLRVKSVIVVGGTGVISNQVITELNGMGIQVERIGGKDRYETAKRIAERIGVNSDKAAVIVNGTQFPDALSIAPWAAMKGYPILPVLNDSLPESTNQVLKDFNIQKTYVIGGAGVVTDHLKGQLINSTRISGKDRYETSIEVFGQLMKGVDKVYLATGDGFADALTGSVLAAKKGSPLLLTLKDQVPVNAVKLLQEKNISQFTILGGTGAISSGVTSTLSNIKVTPAPAPIPTPDPVPTPNPLQLSGKVIVLDAGHGGADPGAVANNCQEKNLNYSLVQRIADHLSDTGATIILTRENDTYYSLSQRVAFTNNQNADLFVSIHHDSSTSETAQGISTHYSSYRPAIPEGMTDAYVVYKGQKYPYVREDENSTVYFMMGAQEASANINNVLVIDPTPTEAAQKSKVLADRLAEDISNLGFRKTYTSTGSRDHNLYVTRWTTMPSVLIEAGFISNPIEVLKISDPVMEDKIAQVITNNIVELLTN